MKNKWITPYIFQWELCAMCGDYVVICPRCGMNCCSGGYGTVEGEVCPVCPDAYEYQEKNWYNRPKLTDEDIEEIEIYHQSFEE